MAEEKKIVEETTDAVSEKNLSELARLYKKLWILVSFCMVGWIAIVIGINTSPFVAILGALVIALPTIVDMKKYGFGSMFNYQYYIETTYADGHKTKTYDTGTNAAMLVFRWLFTIIGGVLLTPIRYIFFVIKYEFLRKKMNIKSDIKNTFLLPSGVGIVVFIVGIIIMSVL